MSQRFKAPVIKTKALTIKQLSRLYRILDNLEESSNMAHEYVRYVDGGSTPVSAFVTELQEYLSEQRGNIVDEMRRRPAADDHDGITRLAVIIQYEAWCEEFNRPTVEQFNASPLAKEAME